MFQASFKPAQETLRRVFVEFRKLSAFTYANVLFDPNVDKKIPYIIVGYKDEKYPTQKVQVSRKTLKSERYSLFQRSHSPTICRRLQRLSAEGTLPPLI